MASKTIADMVRVSTQTPEADRTRREWLTPEAIVADLRKEGLGGDHEMYYRAINLIRVTTFLQATDAERIELIYRILDELTVVSDERG